MNQPARILIVEDRASLRKMLERALSSEGFAVESCSDGLSGVETVDSQPFDLVLTDLKLPGLSGLEVVSACRRRHPPIPVVIMTAYGTVEVAVEAMKRGALDFLEKPVEIDHLYALVNSVLQPAATTSHLFEVAGAPPIVGSHPRLRAALHLLSRVAPMSSTVLLTGESGTGKELFARALHALSPRREGPFIALNCAAIPEALIENELFGHMKGAFTGADRRQAGRFEVANHGTLFLDEIGELSLSVQAKVLRVIEERAFERVGGGATLNVDVRLVAATNQDLTARVEAGLFRRDLFYRLDVFPIELPPLRDRREDLPDLCRHLLARLADQHQLAEQGIPTPRLDPSALSLLAEQEWPGNVRQLANVLERAVILADRALITRADLRPLIRPLGEAAAQPAPRSSERELLRRTLIDHAGNKHRAAEQLGWSYRTLQRRIKKHDLEGVPKYRDG